MSPVAAPAASHPSFIKMEERKRSAAQDDLAPPPKRHAVNGSKNSADADMPWAKDLEVHVTRHQIYPVTLNTPYQSFLTRLILQLCAISGCYIVISMAVANAQLDVSSMLRADSYVSTVSAYDHVSP
jgi:hypothetical protein